VAVGPGPLLVSRRPNDRARENHEIDPRALFVGGERRILRSHVGRVRALGKLHGTPLPPLGALRRRGGRRCVGNRLGGGILRACKRIAA
jgi:hypothetical protein